MPTLKTFSKEIGASTRSSIEIAGLLKKKMMKKMKKKMTEIVKSRMADPCLENWNRVGNLWGNVILDEVPFMILGVFSKRS